MQSKRAFIIWCIGILVCCGIFAAATPARAATARSKYVEADNCYRRLRVDTHRRKYRSNWLGCISKAQKVYRHDPGGPWAAAGLYLTGRLFEDLYKWSSRSSDLQEAADLYARIVKRFPNSRYRPRAQTRLREIGAPETPPKSSTSALVARQKYLAAESCYQDLIRNSSARKYRANWTKCIDGFEALYRYDPDGLWAAAALYQSAKLHLELYGHSYRRADRETGVEIYKRIISGYPQSRYRQKSVEALADLSDTDGTGRPTAKDSVAGQPPSAPGPETIIAAASEASPPSAGESSKSDETATTLSRVTGIRFWSNPSYTRIVIDSESEIDYSHRLLKEDSRLEKPERLYVDLEESLLGEEIKKFVPINDNLLLDVRAGQYTPQDVRVVVDIKSFKTFKIFSLRNPFRIVVDVWGDDRSLSAGTGPAGEPVAKPTGSLVPGALAKQLVLGVRKIVIDPGHGGKDYGAPGYLKGVHEKNVVLQIGKMLARMVREELGIEVVMTRTRDTYLTLEERTAIANTSNADLFISIHTNASRDRRAYGVETYFLNLATDDEAILVAARENATSTKNISDLQTILNDLMQNAKINESSRLAAYVQTNVFQNLKTRKYYRIKNKGVKQAPFYVLLGAQMPAVLVETSFISNARECKRLINKTYQQRLCEGIIKGIKHYIRETTPTAVYRWSQGPKG